MLPSTLEILRDILLEAEFPGKSHRVTRGHLCIKGRFGWEWVNRRE